MPRPDHLYDLHVVLPDDLIRRAKHLAIDRRMSLTSLVEQALRALVERETKGGAR